jgi:CheY-like chemotaxis protein
MSTRFQWKGNYMRIHAKDPSVRNEVLSQLIPMKKVPGAGRQTLPKLNLLVIDDDPLFLRMVRRAATSEQIAVTECNSLDEVDAVAIPGVYDVAIVDYYLDGMRNQLRGPGLAKRLGSTPTILVSQREESVSECDPWPENVRFYLNKGCGPHALLEAALKYREDIRGRV